MASTIFNCEYINDEYFAISWIKEHNKFAKDEYNTFNNAVYFLDILEMLNFNNNKKLYFYTKQNGDYEFSIYPTEDDKCSSLMIDESGKLYFNIPTPDGYSIEMCDCLYNRMEM